MKQITEKTLEFWREVFRNGAKTLLDDLNSGKRDLEWMLEAIYKCLIIQGKSCPIKETPAYRTLKSETKDRSKFSTVEELAPILEAFIESLNN